MAEAVGLAFGTVALASLFSTCVELMDIFELGKSHEYDYDLACLKLALLRTRLYSWGNELGIDTRAHETPDLRQACSEEEYIVTRSLLGIKGIFGNASVLTEKYEVVPRKHRTPSAARLKSSTTTKNSSFASRTSWSSIKRLSSFRRTTTWAIRDKTKFDRLLSDLEFFISSLEHVTVKLRMPNQDEDAQNGGPKKLGRSFVVGSVKDQGVSAQGTQGDSQGVQSSAGQHDSFKIGTVQDQAVSMQGDNSSESIEKVLRGQGERPKAAKAENSASANAPNQSTNFKGNGPVIKE